MKKQHYVLVPILALLIVVTVFPLSPVKASPGTYIVSLNLHETSVGTVNTKNSQGQIFNTTDDWSTSTQELTTTMLTGTWINWTFYLYPVLAGDLVINGAPATIIYFKANKSVGDMNFTSTINKISAAGARTEISEKTGGGQSVGTSYAALTNTHAAASTTVSSTDTLELNITLSGSASNLVVYMAYDTATYNSYMSMVVDDPITVTTTSDKATYEWKESATMTVTVTDDWGGYDISAAPTITWTAPVYSHATTALSTGDTQYSNTYTYTFTMMDIVQLYGHGAGSWPATSNVLDQSSNSFTSASYSFTLNKEAAPGVNPGDPDASPPLAIDPTMGIVAIATFIVLIIIFKVASKPKRRTRKKR